MNKRRIVLLEQVPPSQRESVSTCFYCYCPKHPKNVKAVAAVEVEPPSGQKLFFGICGNHAEMYPRSEEEAKMPTMVCPQCFPRL